MTKSDLIEALAENQSHLALRDVELAVKGVLERMSQSLSKELRERVNSSKAEIAQNDSDPDDTLENPPKTGTDS